MSWPVPLLCGLGCHPGGYPTLKPGARCNRRKVNEFDRIKWSQWWRSSQELAANIRFMNGFHAPLFVVALVLVKDHCAGRNTKFHKVLKLQAHVINFSVILRMCKMLSHLRIRQLHKFGDCLASETHCQVFANLKVNQVCLELMNLLDLWVSQFLNKIHMDLTRVRLFKSETVFWKFAKKKHTHSSLQVPKRAKSLQQHLPLRPNHLRLWRSSPNPGLQSRNSEAGSFVSIQLATFETSPIQPWPAGQSSRRCVSLMGVESSGSARHAGFLVMGVRTALLETLQKAVENRQRLWNQPFS